MTERFVHPDPSERDGPDPPFVVHEAEFVDGRVVRRRTRAMPRPPAGPAPTPGTPDAAAESGTGGTAGSAAARDKVHPHLRRLQREDAAHGRAELIVVYADQPRIPRFPEPVAGEPRDSPSNRVELARAQALAESIGAQRDSRYADLATELATVDSTITVLDRFWLITGMLIEAPLEMVDDIARLPSVISVEPRITPEPPPALHQIDDGRARIASDPFFDLGLPAPWVALLDSGVLASHVLLDNPSHLHAPRDCVDGGATCDSGLNVNPDDVFNHGTAAAAILTGNLNLGNDFRGVTSAFVDSFRVFRPDGQLDQDAARRAFELAETSLCKVIVAEIQGEHDEQSLLALAADSAFDAGAAVIAANGNFGLVGKRVTSPARAHRAIGVGAFDIATSGQLAEQSRGPTDDKRIKPDVSGPTGTLSANTAGPPKIFDGTSGATPYVGGAAALLRSWLIDEKGTTDPGHVYAQLILHGRNVSEPGNKVDAHLNDDSGAGPLRLRRDGTATWAKVEVLAGQDADLTVDLGVGGAQRLDAAVWWPESGTGGDVHNTLTLTVVDPSGNSRPTGSTPESVYERCSVRNPGAGTWVVRVHGAAVAGPAAQEAYVAAFAQPTLMQRLVGQVRARAGRLARRLRRGRPTR